MANLLILRAVLGLLGAAVAFVGGVLMWRHSMRDSNFGPFFADPAMTPVTRYSAPWIVGAAGLMLVAGLLVVAALSDGYRAIRVRRLSRPGQ